MRALPAGMRLLVEYKFFEPGFYSTDLPDWGTAAMVCRRLGPQAQVLVDTGHHPQGTNVEQIVALLLAEGLLGGFHFNNRKYADDDLIVGSIDPFELFRIMREIAHGAGAENIAFMIDQSHNVEGKIDAMIQSVMNIQTAYAKALLVDEARLAEAQARATCSERTGSCSRRSRPTCGRCWRSSGGTRSRRRTLSRRSAPEGSARQRARGAGTPPRVESAYEATANGPMTTGDQRAFVLRVRPEKIDEYIDAHRDVWPEMLDALRGAGIRNYTIFRSGNEVFGYFEADDLAAAALTSRSRRSALAGRTRWPTYSRIACPTPGRRPSRRFFGSTEARALGSAPGLELRARPATTTSRSRSFLRTADVCRSTAWGIC